MSDNIAMGAEVREQRMQQVQTYALNPTSPTLNRDPPSQVLSACGLVLSQTTLLHHSGLSLSLSTRQRLCLARAVYAMPDIFLLDEPLSALPIEVPNPKPPTLYPNATWRLPLPTAASARETLAAHAPTLNAKPRSSEPPLMRQPRSSEPSMPNPKLQTLDRRSGRRPSGLC